MMSILLLPANVAIKAVDSIISLILLDSRISDWDGLAGNTLRRVCKTATWWWETASEMLYHFLEQCWMVNRYLRVFFFSWNSRGFWILLRSQSPNNLFKGLWSVTTMMFGQPMTNIRYFSNAHAITAASLSTGAYLHSASVQNLLPANIWCQPLGLHIGAFSTVHWQCFCRSRKLISSLLQSGARQVTQFLSNVATPFWTRSIITHLQSLNASSRLRFQANLESCLTRSQWVCPGYLVDEPKPWSGICNFPWDWKVEYHLYHGLRRGHSRKSYLEASKLYHILTELEFVYVEHNSILRTLEQEIKSMIKGSLDARVI